VSRLDIAVNDAEVVELGVKIDDGVSVDGGFFLWDQRSIKVPVRIQFSKQKARKKKPPPRKKNERRKGKIEPQVRAMGCKKRKENPSSTHLSVSDNKLQGPTSLSNASSTITSTPLL